MALTSLFQAVAYPTRSTGVASGECGTKSGKSGRLERVVAQSKVRSMTHSRRGGWWLCLYLVPVASQVRNRRHPVCAHIRSQTPNPELSSSLTQTQSHLLPQIQTTSTMGKELQKIIFKPNSQSTEEYTIIVADADAVSTLRVR